MFNVEYNILDNRAVLVSDSTLKSRESLKKEIDHFFDAQIFLRFTNECDEILL